jgi:hypothetical protein
VGRWVVRILHDFYGLFSSEYFVQLLGTTWLRLWGARHSVQMLSSTVELPIERLSIPAAGTTGIIQMLYDAHEMVSAVS